MNKTSKYLFIALSSIVAGLLIAVGVMAFTGPGANQPPTGSGSWVVSTSSLPTGYLFGLTLSNGSDAEHDISIAAGKARDATDAADMILASAITKRFDATWAVGTGNGGMASDESLPTSGTIHIWLIKRSDTGVVDIIANNNATSGLSPTLPTSYDYKRRIGSYRTDSSGNIIKGYWFGTNNIREFSFHDPIIDLNRNPETVTTAVVTGLSVPNGIVVEAVVYVVLYGGGICTPISHEDVSGSTAIDGWGHGELRHIITNTSGQVRTRAVNTGSPYYTKLTTHGWKDSL